MTTTTAAPETGRTRGPFVADERLLQRRRVGPVDRLPAGDILALLPRLPDWPAATVRRTVRLRGATTILNWLLTHPGEGWQDRWMISGADQDTSWIDTPAPGETRLAVTRRQEHVAGLACLLQQRVDPPEHGPQRLIVHRLTSLPVPLITAAQRPPQRLVRLQRIELSQIQPDPHERLRAGRQPLLRACALPGNPHKLLPPVQIGAAHAE